tara:strand:+ start:414 stop:719 length:306 start_codon:yes stop_codon:yes gene_type:complete
MSVLLQVDFPFQGPFGDDMAGALSDLARSINSEPGFVWKIWTENEREQAAGGIYLFTDEACARAYLTMHTERLAEFGISDVRGRIFDVNSALTDLNHGPVG